MAMAMHPGAEVGTNVSNRDAAILAKHLPTQLQNTTAPSATEEAEEGAALQVVRMSRRVLTGFLRQGPPFPTPSAVCDAASKIQAAAVKLITLPPTVHVCADAVRQCESAQVASWDWDTENSSRVAGLLSTLAMLASVCVPSAEDTSLISVRSAVGTLSGRKAVAALASMASSLFVRFNAAVDLASANPPSTTLNTN